MTFFGNCEACGKPVESGATEKSKRPAFPVVGWELLRERGGANAIHGRERVPGRVRHVGCLPDPSDNPDQGALC